MEVADPSNPSRLKNKNISIKSLFKDAKQANDETYLNEKNFARKSSLLFLRVTFPEHSS
jgi:hypothetical protein